MEMVRKCTDIFMMRCIIKAIYTAIYMLALPMVGVSATIRTPYIGKTAILDINTNFAGRTDSLILNSDNYIGKII